MITIIHGDDIVSSRNYFLSERQKYPNAEVFDAKNIDQLGLIEILQPKNLFFEKKAIFIENIFSQKLLDDKDSLNELKKAGKEIDIFLWEGKTLTVSELNKLKDAKIKLFKFPQELFSFLDSIRPKNLQNISLFRSALKNLSEDMIFYMMVRQFRLLLALSSPRHPELDSGSRDSDIRQNDIDELKKLAPWQKNKLLRQSKLFTDIELKRIYSKLYKIDLDIKTGEASSLTSSIDFLLLDI